MYIRE
ncbi:hypothetical protein CISIN_1g0432861mg, partial [Citrus sinensis]